MIKIPAPWTHAITLQELATMNSHVNAQMILNVLMETYAQMIDALVEVVFIQTITTLATITTYAHNPTNVQMEPA